MPTGLDRLSGLCFDADHMEESLVMYLPSMEICGVGRSSEISEISEMRRLNSVFGTYAYAMHAMSMTFANP